ncbi:hypothetical protein EON63_23235, partial [archaeon]
MQLGISQQNEWQMETITGHTHINSPMYIYLFFQFFITCPRLLTHPPLGAGGMASSVWKVLWLRRRQSNMRAYCARRAGVGSVMY